MKGGEGFWKGIGNQFENRAKVREWPFHSEERVREWNFASKKGDSRLLSHCALVPPLCERILSICHFSCIPAIASSLSVLSIHRNSYADIYTGGQQCEKVRCVLLIELWRIVR